ncbi:hypothetical protein RHMOL_Rhmol10G0307800 [Rhododendron molle]|uniref:Uncharacterized protein n=1 Tax=Rhododendron molle TaxID=49168 RepID=A0ACC0M812_RHOML|nr:hypothetical protein RHMOL_Rhmol10G0307800 [Rhododendron molle]
MGKMAMAGLYRRILLSSPAIDFTSSKGKGLSVFTLYLERQADAVRSFSTKRHGDDVIGIDIGNTTSRVAVMVGQAPNVVEKSIPSSVALFSKENILVGAMAKHHASTHARNTIVKMKNLIGRRYDDPQTQKLKSMVPYSIVGDVSGKAFVEASNMRFSPTQIYAFILAEIKKSAEAYLRRTVSKAVIAVPTDFSVEQRKEIEFAGKEAELDVLGIIDEPVAATLSSMSINGGLIAAFDLGGGAFNLSILEISEGNITVKANRSDNFLGGDDFDRALLEYIVSEIKILHSVDVTSDKMVMMRLTEAAEKAKLELSRWTEATVRVIIPTAQGPRRLKINVSHSKFDDIVSPLIERIRTHCAGCLTDARILGEKIDELILVGGMTRIPVVQNIVREIFKGVSSMRVNPEEAVVIGAALEASLLIENTKKLLPGETPLSIGIETFAGNFTRIISRNSRIPVKQSRIFSTESDNQESVRFRIFQGERGMASNNVFVGELELTGIPPAPSGVPRIELSFHIATDSTLHVLAKHKYKESAAEFHLPVSCEDEVRVRSLVKEGILHGLQDEKISTLAELRSMAAMVICRVEKILDMEKTVPDELHNEARVMLADLRMAMESENAYMLVEKIQMAESAGIDLVLWLENPEYNEDDE